MSLNEAIEIENCELVTEPLLAKEDVVEEFNLIDSKCFRCRSQFTDAIQSWYSQSTKCFYPCTNLLSCFQKLFKCQNLYHVDLVHRKLSCGCQQEHKYKCFGALVAVTVLLLLYRYHVSFKSASIISKILVKLEEQDMLHSVMIFTLCFTIVSLPFMWGYIIFNLAAGYFHGFLYGLLVVMFSVAFGTFVNHFVCKYYFSACALNFMKSRNDYAKIQAILNVLNGPTGVKIIALLRLTPIPFGIQNALVAISNMPIRQYMLSSTMGLLPTQALNCYLGSNFRSIQQLTNDGVPGGYLLFAFQMIAGVLLTRFVVKRAKLELDLALKADGDEFVEQGLVESTTATSVVSGNITAVAIDIQPTTSTVS